jgi:hypothetical protein
MDALIRCMTRKGGGRRRGARAASGGPLALASRCRACSRFLCSRQNYVERNLMEVAPPALPIFRAFVVSARGRVTYAPSPAFEGRETFRLLLGSARGAVSRRCTPPLSLRRCHGHPLALRSAA